MQAYVIFKDTPCYWSWLTKKGFGHCFVCIEDENGYWVQLEPMTKSIRILSTILGKKKLREIFEDKKYTVVEVHVDKKETYKPCFFRLGIYDCVQITKYILGISCFALTPYQFYKKLLKRGQDHGKR